MSLTIVDYLVRTNEDWRDSLSLTTGVGDDAEAVDLTGSTFSAQIRSTPDTLLVLMEASTTNGKLVIADAAGGVLSWNIAADEMATLVPAIYAYDMVWTNPDGIIDTFVAGTLTVERGITR